MLFRWIEPNMMGWRRWLGGRRRNWNFILAGNAIFLVACYGGLSLFDVKRDIVHPDAGSDRERAHDRTHAQVIGGLSHGQDHVSLINRSNKPRADVLGTNTTNILATRRAVEYSDSLRIFHPMDAKLKAQIPRGKSTPDADPCNRLAPPDDSHLSDKQFLRVKNDSRETFVYSAHFDGRVHDSPGIRILGLSSGEIPVKYCQVWYRGESHVRVYRAWYKINSETHERRYGASMHVCILEKSEAPYAASIVNNKCDEPDHVLKVISSNASIQPKYNFTVCVTPFNFNFDKTKQLVEMIEVNRILGADHFVFYNFSSGSNVARYLAHYMQLNLIDVIPWDIPLLVDTWPPRADIVPEIHYFGQVMALQDCLYRYMHVSHYIVFTDLDEFVVPRKVRTWNEMIPSLDCPSESSAFMFRCTFFRTDWEDDPEHASNDVITDMGLNTLLKLQREALIYPHYSRSKVIVNPRMIAEKGIHSVTDFIDTSIEQQCEVSEQEALLHHYRLWIDGMVAKVIDKRMLRYTDDIIASTLGIHRAVHGKL